MANNTKNLLDIFNIFASENSTDRSINTTQIRSVLRDMDSEDFESLLVKMMKGLNLTFTCGYCEGSFRDVVHAYNKIHGYISLLVSTKFSISLV